MYIPISVGDNSTCNNQAKKGIRRKTIAIVNAGINLANADYRLDGRGFEKGLLCHYPGLSVKSVDHIMSRTCFIVRILLGVIATGLITVSIFL